MTEHRRHHRNPGRVGTFLRSYNVEIIAASVVALGAPLSLLQK
jgi:hypothetical protein